MTRHPELTAQIAQREASLPCDVVQCGCRVWRLSRYCRQHAYADRRNGHPLGACLTLNLIGPFHRAARRFVESNREHPAVIEAARRIADVVEDAAGRNYSVTSGNDQEALALWAKLHKRYRVDPMETLAVILAVYTFRAWRPGFFQNERHFAAQLSNRALRLVVKAKHNLPGQPQSPWYARYIPVTTRLAFARTVDAKLGSLCRSAAQTINQELQNRPRSTPTQELSQCQT